MNFTDIFVRRPVLAVTISLLILVLGIRAMADLSVRQYPETESATVTVMTAYFGADADTVAGFITQPLEAAIAQAQGIDYLSSSSTSGISTITATLRLNYDANRALTEINTKVNAVTNQLPREAQQPVLQVQTSAQLASMYIGFTSDVLGNNEVTDYLLRVVKPKLDSIEGVQSADIFGSGQFALRAWLDPDQMAAHGVTASDVYSALASNNYLAALGSTKGQMVSVSLTAGTSLHSVDAFKQLAVKQVDGAIVRLDDVARVELGSESYNVSVAFDGKQSVFVAVQVAPDANVLDVIARVRDDFPGIVAQLPSGVHGQVVYDATDFISSSINEVIKTLIEALLIVMLVIYLFLGSFRAVMIPLIAMPMSLIGAFFVMLMFGYSINLLTLLSLVLAIGLVVDDAIIVVENVDRHMKEEGRGPFAAALLGARELGGPIIAMTVVLIAVYVPIGFQGGLTGALFTEFAFTLAGAVTVSGIVALTLSPMMTSRIFKAKQEDGRFVQFIDRKFNRLRGSYERRLHGTLDTKMVPIVMGALLLGATVYLFSTSKAELAPEEDQGVVLANIQGPPNATLQQMQAYSDQVLETAKSLPEFKQIFQLTGIPTTNGGMGGVIFKDWGQRDRGASELQKELQEKWNGIAGARVAAFQFPSLPGAQGLPIQMVIKTTEPFQSLNDVAQKVLAKAQASGQFFFIDSDLKIDKPQATLEVDKDMVTALGMTQQGVGSTLGAALGGGYVNYFSMAGRSYRVMPQVKQVNRLNPDQVLGYHVRTGDGQLIPASTFAHLEHTVVPEAINRFQQLNSATISGVSAVSQDAALKFLETAVREVAPSGYQVDFSGQSRQFMAESGGFVYTMLFAIIIVYLALSALFNSFRDPIVILVAVPMALFGLRPILMTTAAMVLGVLPLVLAAGAGAAGRHSMGLVIFTGMSIGTLFTLFVVPAFYLLLASDHHAEPEHDVLTGLDEVQA